MRALPIYVAMALLLAVMLPRAADARDRCVVFPPDPDQLPAVHYANMSSARCLAELGRRKLPFSLGPKLKTVDTPVRLDGALRGVRFEYLYGQARRNKADILDCRLLLALDDFAGVAASRSIDSVRYNSIFRPGGWRAGVRHPAGVAIDVTELVREDGDTLNVLRDFGGQGIGSRTCGNEASKPSGSKAIEMRELLCAVDRAHIFNLMLTPHYDYRHRNHLHLEVRRGIRWFLTH